MILEKNWLEVYPWEKWNGHDIPEFQEGDVFKNPIIRKMEGKTSPPTLLTEPDLIALLYENGIGMFQLCILSHFTHAEKHRNFFSLKVLMRLFPNILPKSSIANTWINSVKKPKNIFIH